MNPVVRMALSDPWLAFSVAALRATSALRNRSDGPKIIVGTHHKVMTKYLTRVFSAFAAASRRSISVSSGDRIDYRAQILVDHHSQFDFSELSAPLMGVHVRRDPRDLLVSAAFYHLKSTEKWLHKPRTQLGGKSYQEHLRELPTVEARVLFEIDNAGGRSIRQMLQWPYDRAGITEVRYEELVSYDGVKGAAEQVTASWPISKLEKRVLKGFFVYYSIFGVGGRTYGHIRNAKSSQWREVFTERVHERFSDVFPTALEELGYEC